MNDMKGLQTVGTRGWLGPKRSSSAVVKLLRSILHQTLFIATLLSAHSVCPTGKYKLNKIPRHRLPCSTVLYIRLETSLAFFVLPVAWPAGAGHNTGELTGKTGLSSGHREVNSKSGFQNTARLIKPNIHEILLHRWQTCRMTSWRSEL